ncbi:winged helix DNA-binding domain-containing protein [Acrocarpospora macrocephala]|uniref:winged helix DNA-binding domain-containing protein n=1 Tax=Acrocarpospora macrocephala TaxID=150177 RepID=UPI0012D36212|nr:winged helix DNA-binding domain-containing protein [Acrocarpospora macrocephala]
MAVLTLRELNRATLARQLLLRRSDMGVVAALEHLVGLQAQTPHSWYVGLWSRLAGFRAEQAADLLLGRDAVRIAVMRSTIHFVTARDAVWLRPLVQVVIERSTNGAFGKHLKDIDREALTKDGRELVESAPRTPSELGKLLAERWPGRDPAALYQAIRMWLPLVQVPPRGVWGRSGATSHTTTDAWLGRPLATDATPDELVLRYLAAFGPASVKDIQTWCGLTRLAEVTTRLGDRLIRFRDEQGQELFDLPDAPRPPADTPAPIRFLYDYDNLLLSHADRTRFITPEYFRQGFTDNGPMPSIILIDGFTGAHWRITRQRRTATLHIKPFAPLAPADVAAIEEEGARLLAFTEPRTTTHDIQWLPH